MKPARLLFAVAAFAAAGCSAILGIDSDYTPDLDASVSDGEGGSKPDASMQHDATMTGDDAGPVTDAQITDAVSPADVIDSAPATCPDGASSPQVAVPGDPCCADQALACDQGQPLEAMLCTGGKWTPTGPCPAGDLCRTSTGTYPDGGPENGGTIVGNGALSGALGQCAAEIPACTGLQAGDITCAGANGNVLVQCGADLTTAYEETCGSSDLCNNHIGPHCVQCVAGDGGDNYECNGNAPAYCDAGAWVQEPDCDAGYNCHPNDGTCQAQFCAPSTYKCVGDDLQQCDPANGNFYGDAGLCDAGTCDKQGMCDLCVKSTNYGCNGSNTGYTACSSNGQSIVTTNCMSPTPYCFQAAAGGTATCVQCLSTANCSGGNACTTVSCGSGSCSYPPIKDGTIVTQAAAGSCSDTVCMTGTPVPGTEPDGYVTVPPDSTSSTCMETVCTGGVATMQLAPLPQACTTTDGNAGTCDITGACNAN